MLSGPSSGYRGRKWSASRLGQRDSALESIGSTPSRDAVESAGVLH
jgi:hypothetical protein